MLQSVSGYLKYPDILKEHCALIGAWGGVVVKALRY